MENQYNKTHSSVCTIEATAPISRSCANMIAYAYERHIITFYFLGLHIPESLLTTSLDDGLGK